MSVVRLPGLVPGARRAHVVLALEHERARWGTRRCSCRSRRTPTRAAGRRPRWRCGRRSRGRPPRWRRCSARRRRRPPRTCSRGCTCCSRARRDRCRSSPAGRRSRPARRRARRGGRARARRARPGRGRRGLAVALGAGTVAGHQAIDAGRRREIDRGGRAARGPSGATGARARIRCASSIPAPRGASRPGPARGSPHLDHAHAADVDRRQRLEVAQRGDVEPAGAARLENRRAGGHPRRLAVDHDSTGGRAGRSGAIGGRLGGGGP